MKKQLLENPIENLYGLKKSLSLLQAIYWLLSDSQGIPEILMGKIFAVQYFLLLYIEYTITFGTEMKRFHCTAKLSRQNSMTGIILAFVIFSPFCVQISQTRLFQRAGTG